MPSYLGLYIGNNVIKYAKVSKEKDKTKLDSFGIKFYTNISQTIKQIVEETYSYKTPISVNLNGETDSTKFDNILREAVKSNDSVGGIISIKTSNIEVGLGEPYFDSLESTISHLLFSVGGVKGVEFGIGFDGVNLKGSSFNDPIIDEFGHTKTNNNGGINGGISNGNPIELKVFVKPTASIGIPQETYNFKDNKVEELVINGRHDAAIILRAMVVCEACVAIALCDAYLINKAYKEKK